MNMNTQREHARMETPAFRAGRIAAALLACAAFIAPVRADEAPPAGTVLEQVELPSLFSTRDSRGFRFRVVADGDGSATLSTADGSVERAPVKLPLPATSIEAFAFHGKQMLLLGEAAPGVNSVFIDDGKGQGTVDAFLVSNAAFAFGPELVLDGAQSFELNGSLVEPGAILTSTNAKLVAGTRFRPRFENDPALLGDVVVVYDASKTPVENRFASAPGADPAKEQVMVGRPVYPMANYRSAGYLALETEEFNRHEVRSPLVWLDGETLAFVDRSGGIYSLVVIDFANGLEAARHQEIILPVESWLKAGASPDDQRRAMRSFAVNEIARDGDGYRLVFAPSDRMAHGEATIAARP